LALCLFGGKVISTFSLPILIGIIVGTFSSIFVASPILIFLNVKAKEEKAKTKSDIVI
jgi:preprotein translocase subunit SecF